MTPTVLIVDDSQLFRDYLRALLATTQCSILGEADDGLPAITQAGELKPDIVLLDIGLPKLNGIDAARKIRKVSPQSKIIFVSEYRSVLFARTALSVGVNGYVVKSHASVELVSALEVVLEGGTFLSGHLDTD